MESVGESVSDELVSSVGGDCFEGPFVDGECLSDLVSEGRSVDSGGVVEGDG